MQRFNPAWTCPYQTAGNERSYPGKHTFPTSAKGGKPILEEPSKRDARRWRDCWSTLVHNVVHTLVHQAKTTTIKSMAYDMPKGRLALVHTSHPLRHLRRPRPSHHNRNVC